MCSKNFTNIRTLVIVGLLLLSSTAQALIIEGVVVSVKDGDTITILDGNNAQHKIRLAGIDAPEKKQPFGNVSKKSLSDMVYGKQVSVKYTKVDRYNRTVGKVFVDGVDANLLQVKRGLAWFYKKYQNDQQLADRLDYLHAHVAAEQSKTGLWADLNPIAPWDFRKDSQSSKRVKYLPPDSEKTVNSEQFNQSIFVRKTPISTKNIVGERQSDCLNLPTDNDILECLQ